MIEIKVETLDDCSIDCPHFDVLCGGTYYADGEVVERVFMCSNLDLCKRLRKEHDRNDGTQAGRSGDV